MERLADELYAQIMQELSFKPPLDACLVGSVTGFTDKPEIEVTYVLKPSEGEFIGGSLDARFERGILGGYKVTVLQNTSAPLLLNVDEIRKLGICKASLDLRRKSSDQLIDDQQPWILLHVKGSKFFAEDVVSGFAKFVKRLVETKKRGQD